MRAIKIDPQHRSIFLCKTSGSLSSLQAAVGGDIEFAGELNTGDLLYVNSYGRLQDSPSFFTINDKTFAGRGLLVGPEVGIHISDVISTAAEIKRLVGFDPKINLEAPLHVRSRTFNSVAEALAYIRNRRKAGRSSFNRRGRR